MPATRRSPRGHRIVGAANAQESNASPPSSAPAQLTPPKSPPPKSSTSHTTPPEQSSTTENSSPQKSSPPANTSPPEKSSPSRRSRSSPKKIPTATPSYYPPRGCMEEPNMREAMADDFLAFGFDQEKVTSLMATKEPAVDKLGVKIGNTIWDRVREADKKLDTWLKKRERALNTATRARVKGANTETKKSGRNASKSQVYVDAQRNWVLFDPVRGWPPVMKTPPPPIYTRLSHFKPGNEKIVVYNTTSHAIALRGTPASFAGKAVQYLNIGPVLVAEKLEEM